MANTLTLQERNKLASELLATMDEAAAAWTKLAATQPTGTFIATDDSERVAWSTSAGFFFVAQISSHSGRPMVMQGSDVVPFLDSATLMTSTDAAKLVGLSVKLWPVLFSDYCAEQVEQCKKASEKLASMLSTQGVH